MISVHYQLIFPDRFNFQRRVEEIVRQTLLDIEMMDETASSEEWPFTVYNQYTHALPNKQFLVSVFIELDDGLGDARQIIDRITEDLSQADEILHLFKYYDSSLRDLIRYYAAELFDLEMRLREVLSLIFIDRYPGSPYDLFHETDVKLQNLAKNQWQKNKGKKESDLKEKHENEFFHVLFSDYAKCATLRELKERELFPYLQDAENFESFRKLILTRGIHHEKNKDFLVSLQGLMESLEEVRNCIAHNRTPTDEMINSFDRAKEIIQSKIDDLWTFWDFVGSYETEVF